MVHDLTDYLDNAGIKLLVVACNTITVLGTESIRNGYAFDVVGMSKGAELALGVTKNKKIGVMATLLPWQAARTRLPLTRLTQTRKFLRRDAPILCR